MEISLLTTYANLSPLMRLNKLFVKLLLLIIQVKLLVLVMA